MTVEKNNKGLVIWEVDEKSRVPKQVFIGNLDMYIVAFDELDLDNKTYAIRIGKSGLK